MIAITAALSGHQLNISNGGSVLTRSRVVLPSGSVNVDVIEVGIFGSSSEWEDYPILRAVFWRDDDPDTTYTANVANSTITIPRAALEKPGLLNFAMYAANGEDDGARKYTRLTSNAVQITVEQGPML